jgi:hypothetical protein
MDALRSGQAHFLVNAIFFTCGTRGMAQEALDQASAGRSWRLKRSKFDDGDGDGPMRWQRRSAKRIRGREGKREIEREGRNEKGVATWRPKYRESSELYCFGILLLLLLGIWSCIVSDSLIFSSKVHCNLRNTTPVANQKC